MAYVLKDSEYAEFKAAMKLLRNVRGGPGILVTSAAGSLVISAAEGYKRRGTIPGPLTSGLTPDTVGSTDETEAAATDEWDADATDASPNVNVTMQTRTAYNHAGDQKLYAYYRTFSYNCGRLIAVSAETRVEIDPTEACA